ncbi:MAG: hypothetical protein KY469_04020 [Actinobacteria bacterium]|nr:hypothetical protein [Actinomycetota bacterium]
MPDTSREPDGLFQIPDDLPRKGLFAEPLVVADLRALEPESRGEGELRVRFRLTVKDAEGRRCPDIYVQARIDGPERSGTGTANTNVMGAAEFRMTGPAGRYAIEVLDVGAGGLDWDRDAGPTRCVTTA